MGGLKTKGGWVVVDRAQLTREVVSRPKDSLPFIYTWAPSNLRLDLCSWGLGELNPLSCLVQAYLRWMVLRHTMHIGDGNALEEGNPGQATMI